MQSKYEQQTYLFGLGDRSTVEDPSGRTLLVTTWIANKFGKSHLVIYFCCLCSRGCGDAIPGWEWMTSNFLTRNSAALILRLSIRFLLKLNFLGGTNGDWNSCINFFGFLTYLFCCVSLLGSCSKHWVKTFYGVLINCCQKLLNNQVHWMCVFMPIL